MSSGAEWIKEMRVGVQCDGCIVNEHAAALAVQERDTALADLEYCRESRNGLWRDRERWRHVACLEGFALVVLFVLAIAGWAK